MWGELFNKNLLLSFVEAVSNFDMAKLVESETTAEPKGTPSAPSGTETANTWSFFSISGFLFFWVATVATKFMVGSQTVPTVGGQINVPSTDAAALAADPNATMAVTLETGTDFIVRYPPFSFTDQSKLLSLYFWLFVIFSASFILLRYFFKTKTIIKFIESGAIIVLMSMTMIILVISSTILIQPNPRTMENIKNFLNPTSVLESAYICGIVVAILLVISLIKNRDRLNDNRMNFYTVVKWIASVVVVISISSAIMYIAVGFNPPYIDSAIPSS